MQLVIFDIDHTLVLGPSTEQRFFRQLVQNRTLGPRQWATYLLGLLLWTPLFGRDVLKKNKAYLAGLDTDDVSRLANAWAETGLSSAWYEPAVDRLRQHQAAGDHVVLMSGTPSFIAQAVGERLKVAHTIGSICGARAGRFTFQALQRHPCGAEKLRLARKLAAAHGFRPEQIVAYGDSVQDAALLGWVGTPIAVLPDYRLAKMAQANGWEVLGQRLLAP